MRPVLIANSAQQAKYPRKIALSVRNAHRVRSQMTTTRAATRVPQENTPAVLLLVANALAASKYPERNVPNAPRENTRVRVRLNAMVVLRDIFRTFVEATNARPAPLGAIP